MGTQRLRRGPGCTVQACVYEQVQILVLVYTDDMCMVAGKVWVHVHMDRYTRLYTHTHTSKPDGRDLAVCDIQLRIQSRASTSNHWAPRGSVAILV